MVQGGPWNGRWKARVAHLPRDLCYGCNTQSQPCIIDQDVHLQRSHDYLTFCGAKCTPCDRTKHPQAHLSKIGGKLRGQGCNAVKVPYVQRDHVNRHLPTSQSDAGNERLSMSHNSTQASASAPRFPSTKQRTLLIMCCIRRSSPRLEAAIFAQRSR